MGAQTKQAWRDRARRLKVAVYALYFAYRHPRTPWYARLFCACLVAYAFSPIDLIPDAIPVLGQLDDLVIVPLGIVLALKMIPTPVMEECREQAQAMMRQGKPRNRVAAAVIVALWLLLGALGVVAIARIILA